MAANDIKCSSTVSLGDRDQDVVNRSRDSPSLLKEKSSSDTEEKQTVPAQEGDEFEEKASLVKQVWRKLQLRDLWKQFGYLLFRDPGIGSRTESDWLLVGSVSSRLSSVLLLDSKLKTPTVIVGLFLQQVIALFVLKTDAGFKIFKWIATLSSDFLAQGEVGAQFFFDADTIAKHWFFVNTLGSIIFFIAFVQMLYYLGVMQWVIKHFAWLFFKLLDVSGAEAVVAAASPFIGQDVTMTSGFSTIAGSVLVAYINLGVPAQNLITSSVMSIPASISISKMRLPETEEPVTRGHVTVDRGDNLQNRPANALHAFSNGAVFGLIVAGNILINGLLTWIGRGFGIHHLTLELVIGYIFYPLTFFLSVPRAEILRVSQLFATKLVANEFAAYLSLQSIMESNNPLSHRAFTVASYGLCGFANLGSLGIQIGVLSSLAPSRGKVIAQIALSAMICGFLSTLQTAGIVGMLI
ncbi:hypothetical protein H0H93_015990 [Arthromyces matolae]|nr:hypothetical protein H0H93_015990 [Arthromyces matolae]